MHIQKSVYLETYSNAEEMFWGYCDSIGSNIDESSGGVRARQMLREANMPKKRCMMLTNDYCNFNCSLEFWSLQHAPKSASNTIACRFHSLSIPKSGSRWNYWWKWRWQGREILSTP